MDYDTKFKNLENLIEVLKEKDRMIDSEKVISLAKEWIDNISLLFKINSSPHIQIISINRVLIETLSTPVMYLIIEYLIQKFDLIDGPLYINPYNLAILNYMIEFRILNERKQILYAGTKFANGIQLKKYLLHSIQNLKWTDDMISFYINFYKNCVLTNDEFKKIIIKVSVVSLSSKFRNFGKILPLLLNFVEEKNENATMLRIAIHTLIKTFNHITVRCYLKEIKINLDESKELAHLEDSIMYINRVVIPLSLTINSHPEYFKEFLKFIKDTQIFSIELINPFNLIILIFSHNTLEVIDLIINWLVKYYKNCETSCQYRRLFKGKLFKDYCQTLVKTLNVLTYVQINNSNEPTTDDSIYNYNNKNEIKREGVDLNIFYYQKLMIFLIHLVNYNPNNNRDSLDVLHVLKSLDSLHKYDVNVYLKINLLAVYTIKNVFKNMILNNDPKIASEVRTSILKNVLEESLKSIRSPVQTAIYYDVLDFIVTSYLPYLSKYDLSHASLDKSKNSQVNTNVNVGGIMSNKQNEYYYKKEVFHLVTAIKEYIATFMVKYSCIDADLIDTVIISRLMCSIMPLITIPSARVKETCLLVFRKALFSRQLQWRKIAVIGFCELLKHLKIITELSFTQIITNSIEMSQVWCASKNSSQDNEQICIEILRCLKRFLRQNDVTVKCIIYDYTKEICDKNPAMLRLMLECLYEHFAEFLNNSQDPVILKIEKCIKYDNDRCSIIVNDSLGHLTHSLLFCLLKAHRLTNRAKNVLHENDDNTLVNQSSFQIRSYQSLVDKINLDFERIVFSMIKLELEDFEIIDRTGIDYRHKMEIEIHIEFQHIKALIVSQIYASLIQYALVVDMPNTIDIVTTNSNLSTSYLQYIKYENENCEMAIKLFSVYRKFYDVSVINPGPKLLTKTLTTFKLPFHFLNIIMEDLLLMNNKDPLMILKRDVNFVIFICSNYSQYFKSNFQNKMIIV
ncbi:uncharacterized protein LOC135924230 [Gordionus sp. m RMFG-2023]|uniref:uncharacterized protein LOC135924230 n=1 Tax=Gordionus sp. m RMFG-2023 TaxID=3053472 RepID=UPI0031FCD986